MNSKGPSRAPVGDPRGSDFVREQQRAWTWDGFEASGFTDRWGEYARFRFTNIWQHQEHEYVAKKHPRAQQCIAACNGLRRLMRVLYGEPEVQAKD